MITSGLAGSSSDANLDVQGTGRAIQQQGTVELGGIADAGDLINYIRGKACQ